MVLLTVAALADVHRDIRSTVAALTLKHERNPIGVAAARKARFWPAFAAGSFLRASAPNEWPTSLRFHPRCPRPTTDDAGNFVPPAAGNGRTCPACRSGAGCRALHLSSTRWQRQSRFAETQSARFFWSRSRCCCTVGDTALRRMVCDPKTEKVTLVL